jgi:predicted transcriptional regulator
MNKDRRKMIAQITEDVQKAINLLEDVQGDIETVRDEEQDYLDAMPESMQGGEKGEMAQEAIDALEEALEAVSSLLDAGVADLLDTAAQ